MMSLRNLAALVALAEERHFGRAAARLAVTQPAFSRRIQALEAELGLQLVARTTREVRLTPSGERFAERAREALDRLGQAVTDAKAEAAGQRGLLRIGYNAFALHGPFIRVLRRYRELLPEVELDLRFIPSHEQLTSVAEGTLDLGFVVGPAPEGVESLTVQRERLMAVLPEGHPLAGGDRPLAAFAGESFVLGRRDIWRSFRLALDRLFVTAGFVPMVVQEAHTEEAVLGLVAAGIGVTIDVEGSLAVPRPGLAYAGLAGCKETIDTDLVWRRGESSPQMKPFIELTRAAL